ncbi:MAG: hypothetical protein ABJO09_15020 [Hyphomicrobiales bacterium]
MRGFSFFYTLILLIFVPNIALGFGALGSVVEDPRMALKEQSDDGKNLAIFGKNSANNLVVKVMQRFTDRRLPKFENFPARPYSGRVSAPNLQSHPEANTYRTRLRNAAKGSVSFAGEYAVATWGCGASCITGAIVNAKTGNVIFFPGTICCWERDEENIMDYQLDSRLLILRGAIDEQDLVATHYYVLGNNRFDLIYTKTSNSNPPHFGHQTQSSPDRIASSGANIDVTDYGLLNDTNIDITIRWLDGQAWEQPVYDGLQTPDDQWVFPGEEWQIANGAKTWESHWYAVFSRDGFVCSFSPRQWERVNFSQLDGCNVSNFANSQNDDEFTAPKRLEDNEFAIGTYSSNSAPSGNIEMNRDTYQLKWTEFCGPQIKLTADWSFGQLTTNQPNPQIFELEISEYGEVVGFQVGQHKYVKEEGIMMPGCVGIDTGNAPPPRRALPQPNLPKLNAPRRNLPTPNIPIPNLPKINMPTVQ